MPVCLSGACATDGQDAVDAAKLAIDEINKNLEFNFKLSLKAEDTAAAISAAKAVTAYKKLRSQGIKYFIGPSWTPGGLALAPIIKNDQVIMISPSLGDARFHLASKNIFNLWGTDESNSRKIAEIAYQNGCKEAAILASHQPWELAQGDFFENQFEKIDGKVLIKIQVQPGATNFKNEALKIKLANPDCLFMANYISLGLAAKDLKKAGFNQQIYSVIIDEQRLTESAGTLEGAKFLDFKEAESKFIRKFSNNYKRPTRRVAANAYDASYILALAINQAINLAIKEAKTDSISTLANTILNLDYDGATGKLSFDENGCAKTESDLYIIKSGRKTKLNGSITKANSSS